MDNVKKNVHFDLNLYIFLYETIGKSGTVLINFAFCVNIYINTKKLTFRIFYVKIFLTMFEIFVRIRSEFVETHFEIKF